MHQGTKNHVIGSQALFSIDIHELLAKIYLKTSSLHAMDDNQV